MSERIIDEQAWIVFASQSERVTTSARAEDGDRMLEEFRKRFPKEDVSVADRCKLWLGKKDDDCRICYLSTLIQECYTCQRSKIFVRYDPEIPNSAQCKEPSK